MTRLPNLRRAWTLLTWGIGGAASTLLAWQTAQLPDSAPVIEPAAGLALAASLSGGPSALLALGLGVGVAHGVASSGHVAWTLAAGLGLFVQAWLGAWAMQRLSRSVLAMDGPREALALVLVGGVVASLIRPSLLMLGLLAAPLPEARSSWPLWAGWWAAEALGVVLVTPIVVAGMRRVRTHWQGRRNTIIVSLSILIATLVAVTLEAREAENHRRRDRFDLDANRAADALQTRLREHLHALEAMRGLFLASNDVTDTELETAAASWLQGDNGVRAIGYAQRVLRADLDAFEARMRRTSSGYRAFDRDDAPAGLTAADPDVLPIRLIEPRATNAAALGVNTLSVPAAREAVLRTLASDLPSASGGFRLTQAQAPRVGVVIYRAVYPDGTASNPSARRNTASGVVFVTVEIEQSIAALQARHPPHLAWCLVDRDAAGTARRLAGPVGCEVSPGQDRRLVRARAMDYGGRPWELQISERPAVQQGLDRWFPVGLSGAGLTAAILMVTLLLTITGRARRVELAVKARTADLRSEIEERRRTSQALQTSEQRLRNILDHLPVGVVYADFDGEIIAVNPHLRELLHLEAPHPLGQRLATLLPEAERDGLRIAFEALRRQPETTLQRQWPLLPAEGPLMWTQVSLSALRDEHGQAKQLVAVFEDITQRLRLADLELARQRAEAASQAKTDFLSRMSHELRTPLNAILGFTQLLSLDRQPPLSPRQAERAEQVQKAGWHLLHMIDDMLDLSRIEAGQIQFQARNIRVADQVVEALGLVELAAAQREVQIIDASQDTPWVVAADPTRLKQILTNLFSNAIKYNRDRGTVHISVSRDHDDLVSLRVKDTGMGMSAAQLRGLFQPFNRVGRERGQIDGTGLGLVISRRLAELMGGSLVADSVESEGSVFVLRLPAGTPEQASERSSEARTVPAAIQRKRRVLYIEDNPVNAEVMRGVLARRPQIEFVVTDTAQAGLASIRDAPPDLLLLDMHLPDCNGLDVLDTLRADPTTSRLPVMVVSADATAMSIEQAFRAGAHDYVTKPVDVTTFLSQLDLLLERQEAHLTR